MSGLVKPKSYDWKDSNVALFGSDTDRQVKKESAETEPAWQGAGEEVGLKIWRIVNFEVKDWPKADYGKFYDGDSYIILNTYKPDPDSEALAWDVHFWIGGRSTQDEYGTAAYKTVELDTFLDDAAVQYRETQGHESPLFLSYFKSVTIMSGGAESGFRHVTPEEYKPRLLQFQKKNKASKVVLIEVPLCRGRLNPDDVFILDSGSKLVQWNGSGSNKDERFKAMVYLSDMKSERGACESETVEEGDESKEFFETLDGEDEEDGDEADEEGVSKLLKVSDESGEIAITEVKDGDISIDDLESNDVFIVDKGDSVFVWVGSGASPAEKKNGFAYAQKHLSGTSHKLASIAVVKQGQHCPAFNAALAA